MLIALENVGKDYQMGEVLVRALRGVSLEIDKGEMVAIMGPSGSGKSTMMNILGCLDQATHGEYYLDGVNVSTLDDNALAEVRNRQIGFVFQNYNLLARTPAIDQVELPLIYSGARDRRQRATQALETVGLGGRVHHKPNELSGGEQQRVAIARAIINDPSILLADEPTGNLDTKTGIEILGLFQRLNLERGITVLFVTHDPETALYTERVIRLRDGAIEGEEMVENPVYAPGVRPRETGHDDEL